MRALCGHFAARGFPGSGKFAVTRDGWPVRLSVEAAGEAHRVRRAPASRYSHLEAVADPDLTAVITAWPDLPPHVREAIAVLVGSDDRVRKKRRKRKKGEHKTTSGTGPETDS